MSITSRLLHSLLNCINISVNQSLCLSNQINTSHYFQYLPISTLSSLKCILSKADLSLLKSNQVKIFISNSINTIIISSLSFNYTLKVFPMYFNVFEYSINEDNEYTDNCLDIEDNDQSNAPMIQIQAPTISISFADNTDNDAHSQSPQYNNTVYDLNQLHQQAKDVEYKPKPNGNTLLSNTLYYPHMIN